MQGILDGETDPAGLDTRTKSNSLRSLSDGGLCNRRLTISSPVLRRRWRKHSNTSPNRSLLLQRDWMSPQLLGNVQVIVSGRTVEGCRES